jgi:hypothetical protein
MLGILGMISVINVSHSLFVSEGGEGVEGVVEAMVIEREKKEEESLSLCCSILWNLCGSDCSVWCVVEGRDVEVVVEMLNDEWVISNIDIVKALFGTLSCLAFDGFL